MTRRIATTNREGLERIFGAVRTVENGGRSQSPNQPRYMAWDGEGGSIVLSKTSADWAKGTAATLAVYSGAHGSETATSETVTAHNYFGKVLANKWVMLGQNADGRYYLIAPESDQVQVVTSAAIVSTTVSGVTTSKLVFTRKKVWVHSIENGDDVELGLAECVPTYSGG